VRIAEVANDAIANMWAELLENEGIPCFVQASGLSLSVWSYAATMSHYLVVRARDEVGARTLISEIAGQDPSITICSDPKRL
jgi:hypothetical protein